MALAEARNKMLFEISPDIFPEGCVTDVEIALWELYYEAKNRDG